jgi:hypothetical protein
MPLSLQRFLARQQVLIVVAVVVYAMFWAIGQMASISITLIYSLGLGNVTLFLMDRLEFLYCEQRGSPVPVAHVFMFARQFRFFPSTKLFWD